MLVNVFFKNFYSFSDEQEISLEVGKKPTESHYDIYTESRLRLNKVTAIIGPNGAGKTHMLRPLAFLGSFVCQSFHSWKAGENIPFFPHKLHKDEPTEIELDFIYKEVPYKYRLQLTEKEILHESLYKKTSRSYSYVFLRQKNEDGYEYKQKSFGFTKKLADGARNNLSIISLAAQHGVQQALDIQEYFSSFHFNINMMGRTHFDNGDLFTAAEFLDKNQEVKERVHTAICEFDLGLHAIKYKERKFTDENGDEHELKYPVGVHKCENGEFELNFFEESSGTKSAFVMLSRLLPVLNNGGLGIIDEIDNDLHPHMLPVILDWFKHQETNPHNAQLLFTCHTPEILNTLQKHQVYLVEKECLSSEAWRLDEVTGLRADDNLYAKYMAGALYAVPELI